MGTESNTKSLTKSFDTMFIELTRDLERRETRDSIVRSITGIFDGNGVPLRDVLTRPDLLILVNPQTSSLLD